MDDINTQNQYMDYQPEERPGWWSRTMSGLKSGATMYAAGTALSKVPKMGWAGNALKSFGKFDVQTAPIYSTTDPLADKLRNESTPTTTKGHAKKWLRNTGTEAGISAGLWGVGKGVALAGAATANPLVAGAGTALMGLGSMGMAYSWLSPTISTAIDVWLNKRNKAAQQQQMKPLVNPTGQPKMASYLKGNTTMNYVELVQMIKSAGANAAAQDFMDRFDTQYQQGVDKANRFERPFIQQMKPVIQAQVEPPVEVARQIGVRDQILGGGAAGLGAAGLTYAGLGAIPALKKRKLLRALAAVAGGTGVGILAGNGIGRGSFNSTMHSYVNAAQNSNQKLLDTMRGNVKKAAYTPVPQQAQQQTDQNPKITAGRVIGSGLAGAGIGLATAGVGSIGGSIVGGLATGIPAGQRMKKYVPVAYGGKSNYALNNLSARVNRGTRLNNTIQRAAFRGANRGQAIGALASIPVAAIAGHAYGKHLRNKWQQQDAQQAG